MSDNTPLNPGAGPLNARTLERTANVQTQVVQLDVGGGAGNPEKLVNADNPMPVDASGELLDAIRSLQLAVQSLTRSIGLSMPDAAGRLRVLTDASSALGTVSTVTNVTTLATLSTLTNQAQVGGLAAQDQIAALMRTSADMLRQSTVVTS